MYQAVCPNRTNTLREEWPVKVVGVLQPTSIAPLQLAEPAS